MVLAALPAAAQYSNSNEFCEQTRYREVYMPGGYDRYGNYTPGYVKTESYKDQCSGSTYYRQSQPQYQRNTVCKPSNTIFGALLGGGIAASISKPDAYGWSIPLGAVGGGLLLGCND